MVIYMSSSHIQTGQTFRYYNNFTKSHDTVTVTAVAADGYATVTDGSRVKRMPVAALATWELA